MVSMVRFLFMFFVMNWHVYYGGCVDGHGFVYRSGLMMDRHEVVRHFMVLLLSLVADDALGRHGVMDFRGVDLVDWCVDFVDWSYVDMLDWNGDGVDGDCVVYFNLLGLFMLDDCLVLVLVVLAVDCRY